MQRKKAMIHILSFDLDGTLVKSTFADAVWLEGLPRLYAQEKQTSLEHAKHLLYQEYDRIGENRKEWYDIAWWFQRFHLHASWEDLLCSYRKTIQVYPEVQKTLQHLSHEYSLVVLSNAKKEFIEIQLEETKLEQYFTRTFSSISDFHAVKKSPQAYQKMCQSLNRNPQELLHIGDHKEFDYHSPRTIGVEAYFLDRTGVDQGDTVLHTLHELRAILEKKKR
ncbi:MAG: HAD family hydrolase [Methanobacteriota archaeon]